MDASEAREILDGYGSADPARVLDALEHVARCVRTEQVREYLYRKIRDARAAGTREACAPLRPYLEWYAQGAR